ncbi:MAG: type II CRISPR RNA-guided endonuclease Cas9 [Beijerinckiaceae bacterium]|nr:type II CRISPR RNA-guided endonuclease Cas9 [Beijerinckiaceae bacterium]
MERDLLASRLLQGSSLKWDQVRRALKLGSIVRFNREDFEPEIKGCQTAKRLGSSKNLGSAWHSLPLVKKDQMVLELLMQEDEETLISWLCCELDLSHEQATAVAATPLPDGYGRLGLTANTVILEELQRDVITYSQAAARAGYHHSDFATEKGARLPYYGRALERHVAFGTGDPADPEDTRYGRIANPTVHIGLNQLRRLTNRLIQSYGKPDEVILELARDLKLTKKQKDEEQKRNRDNRTVNELRVKKLHDIGIPDNALNRLLLRLWEEQRDGAHSFCPYSGAQISVVQLFSDETEIDHILPFSQTLDDSAANKVVCFREANREKRNRSPFAAFGHRANWQAISLNAEKLAGNKRWRFAPDAMDRFNTEGRDFLDRQLNETKYLSRIARDYLSVVADDVWVSTGNLTAMLRGKWGLNSILSDDNRKNRDDHRHHAIDAAVIGCMSRGLLNEMSRRAGQTELNQRHQIIADVPVPYEGFRDQVREFARTMVVSHKPEHGKTGALHEETAYGIVRNDEERKTGNLIYRKALTALTAKDIDRVRDPILRQQLIYVRERRPHPPTNWMLRLPNLRRASTIRTNLSELAVLPSVMSVCLRPKHPSSRFRTVTAWPIRQLFPARIGAWMLFPFGTGREGLSGRASQHQCSKSIKKDGGLNGSAIGLAGS